MPDLATRLVQDNLPGYPNAGAVPPGSRVEFTLSQPVFNASNNKDENMVVVAPINPMTGDMGFPDPNDATQFGARLFCNDDPNCKPQGSFWRVHYVIAGPGPTRPDLAVVVSTGNTDPVNLGTLAQPVGGTVAYGIRVKEVDGAPDVSNVMTLIVSNGTLTDDGGQTVTLVTGAGGGGGSGTVTSVGLTGDGTVFNATVPGSPVTTSGNFAPTLHTQTANTAFAGPTTGAAAAPAFRALVAADLPAATTAAQGAAVLATPSSDVTAGHVVQASDARLSDARTPSTPTTKGDLVGFSTVPARVPVGTNGQQLMADSTQALGLRWDAIVKEFSWTATGYGYFQAGTAMTLDQAVTPNGTFAYDKASAGALGTFSSTSLPVTLAAGDVLRVNCSALANSYGALVLKRTS